MSDKEFSANVEKYKKMVSQNKRRKYLGVKVKVFSQDRESFFKDKNSRYKRNGSFSPLVDSFVGNSVLSRSDRWKMLYRSRAFLSRRELDDSLRASLPVGLRSKKAPTVLDLFPALKYSYSASLPSHVIAKKRGMSVDSFSRSRAVCYFDFSCNADGSSKKARCNDLSRSGSIRLDPVDSCRRLFIYRLRIQRCISWGYSMGLVPLMMTVTVFHRWHPLRGLLNVLHDAWNYFFTASTAAVKRSKRMGLVGYIRRAEETINNVSGSRGGYNSGWHPHYHVILFVPPDKVPVVDSMEDELREAWYKAVNRFFQREFGESIDPSYEDAFLKHGLFFSRMHDDDGAPLRHVDDSKYMSKVMGVAPSAVYCGDGEMTSTSSKGSKIPFDLLLEDTAENNDLWVEYALATKNIPSFIFSRGLEARVKSYFEEHIDLDPVKPLVKSDKVVAQLDVQLYKLVEQNFQIDAMMRAAANGYGALYDWFKDFYIERGVPADDITNDMLPLPPGSRTPFGDVMPIDDDVTKATTSSVDYNKPFEHKNFPIPVVPCYPVHHVNWSLFDSSEQLADYLHCCKLAQEQAHYDSLPEEVKRRWAEIEFLEMRARAHREKRELRRQRRRDKKLGIIRRPDGSVQYSDGTIQGSLIELGLMGYDKSLDKEPIEITRRNDPYAIWLFDKDGTFILPESQANMLKYEAIGLPGGESSRQLLKDLVKKSPYNSLEEFLEKSLEEVAKKSSDADG